MQSSLVLLVLCTLAALVFTQQADDLNAEKRMRSFAFAKRGGYRNFAFAKRSDEVEEDPEEVEKRARFAFAKRGYRQFAFAKRGYRQFAFA